MSHSHIGCILQLHNKLISSDILLNIADTNAFRSIRHCTSVVLCWRMRHEPRCPRTQSRSYGISRSLWKLRWRWYQRSHTSRTAVSRLLTWTNWALQTFYVSVTVVSPVISFEIRLHVTALHCWMRSQDRSVEVKVASQLQQYDSVLSLIWFLRFTSASSGCFNVHTTHHAGSSAVCSFCAIAAAVPPRPEDVTVPVIVLFTIVSSCVTDCNFNIVRCPCNGPIELCKRFM